MTIHEIVEELAPTILVDREICLMSMLGAIRKSNDDHEAKTWIRAYVGVVGPAVLSVTWIHDKRAINYLLYRATTKTMLAFAKGLMDLLPQQGEQSC